MAHLRARNNRLEHHSSKAHCSLNTFSFWLKYLVLKTYSEKVEYVLNMFSNMIHHFIFWRPEAKHAALRAISGTTPWDILGADAK